MMPHDPAAGDRAVSRPGVVRLVTAELAEDDLAYGVEVDAVYAALVASCANIDPCRAVLAMLVCGDFQTMPRLRVLAVRPRYGGPLGDTHLRNVDGVMLYGDDFAMPGDAVLVRLRGCAVDAKSALRFALLDCPGVTKSAAFERVRQLCPRTTCAPLKGIGVARGLTLG
jgi:hypothetical protein